MSLRQTSIGLAFAAAVVMPALARAQSPWIVSLTPTVNPLPIGSCGAVWLAVTDANGRETPRNAAGYRVSLADFDLAVTAPDTAAVVGQYHGANNWSVCACQGAAVGTIATITAAYPARALVERDRVRGIAASASATIETAAARGESNPPGCPAVNVPAIARVSRIGTSPVSTAPMPSGPAIAVGPPAPTGFRLTPSVPIIASLAWDSMPNAVAYVLWRGGSGIPTVQRVSVSQTAAKSARDTIPDPRITYRYTLVAHYDDGTSATSPAVEFTSPPLANPSGFTMTQQGQTSTQAAMEFSWSAVPGAVQYRLDGPGLPVTGHHVATTTAAASVPRGAGSWKVTALYAGNFADYASAATVSRVVRILPTHSQPWLRKPNGSGSEQDVQMPYEYQPSCDPLGLICNFESDPPSPMHVFDRRYADRMGTSLQHFVARYPFGSPTKLGLWLAVNLKLWDDPAQAANEAVYGNHGDLGVGRRTACAQSAKGGSMPGLHTVCYASAHGMAPGEPGFNDPNLITQPGNNENRLLTMVIKKDPSGSVFMAFTPAEQFTVSPTVALDTEGDKYLPHVCLACHGGTYNPATRKVDGASFLPIDPGLQVFSSPAEKTRQEFSIRRINEIIANSGSSAAVTAYINGLYGNAVSVPHQQATPDYVPAGWQEQAGLYRQVVRPYCAMCHLAASSDRSFASWGNFQANAALIRAAVCSAHTMPHAELQFREFWLKDTGSLYLPGLLATSLGFPSC